LAGREGVGWVLARVVEVKVACYKAGLLEKERGSYKGSYSLPRVRSAYRSIIDVRNSK
jgi:hypothetical protein